MLLNIFASRETYISRIYETMQKGYYNKLYTYIKEHIHD